MNKDLVESLQKVKEDFYTSETKNRFFKKEQKSRCSETVLKRFELSELLSKTIYPINGSNLIFIDFPLLKLYSNESVEQDIVDYAINTLLTCIQTNGTYEIHLDLNGLTISNIERYRSSIESFCRKCIITAASTGINFALAIKMLYIYNTPSIIQSIHTIFGRLISPHLKGKIQHFNKKESIDRILHIMGDI